MYELTQRLQEQKKFKFLSLSKLYQEKTHKFKLVLKPGFKHFGPLGYAYNHASFKAACNRSTGL